MRTCVNWVACVQGVAIPDFLEALVIKMIFYSLHGKH